MKNPNINHKYQYLIKKVALALAIMGMIAIAVRLYTAELNSFIFFLACTLVVFYFGIYFLVGKDLSERFSSWALAASTFFVLSLAGFFLGGIASPVLTIFPFVCVVSFLILRGNGGWYFSIATVVAILVFMFFEYQGFKLPENTLNEFQTVMMRGVWLLFATIMISITMYYFKEENVRLEEKLFEESITDHMTGLYNRRFFEKLIKIELSRIERNKTWLSALLIDIDYFKLYNDNYGHQAGDKVLIQIAEELQSYFKRSTDTVVRYGGEEFLVILSDTSFDDAYELAEGFRTAVRNMNILHSGSDYKTLTVSIGINSVSGQQRNTVEGLIKKADIALYESKEQGRNKTMPESFQAVSILKGAEE